MTNKQQEHYKQVLEREKKNKIKVTSSASQQ